ncbi:YeiH family protein [Photobacterium indicum]|uniref:YeiH family putative sulfate export transporter n=1 Tax=Photobacterium indicum TaxID=81447 RepID=A0A2T3LDA7_9GAMM|nr:YeiH family protein [Photobacterium indicum]PSV49363.1 YeiH family putative sulfate export transporter [Photobacterium indicum]
MKYLSGLLITFVMGIVSFQLADLQFCKDYQLSPLVICIVLGMIIGNVFQKSIPQGSQIGIKFSQQKLLRLGIILYGFFITFQQIIAVGMTGLIVDVIIIATTFIGGSWLGMKVLGLDKETSMLTSAGSAICGAAAILAAEPIVKSKPHQTAVAVATVVIFGTIAMFLFPVIYTSFGIDAQTMGIFTGATIHEVAQVVAAGNTMGQDVGVTSVIVKLTRVMLLAPFLIGLSVYLSKSDKNSGEEKAKITIPWFAVFFVVIAGINSFDLIPQEVVSVLTKASVFFLTMAMGALGIDTNIAKIRGVGIKPILLAAILFAWLIFGGYGITVGVQSIFN